MITSPALLVYRDPDDSIRTRILFRNHKYFSLRKHLTATADLLLIESSQSRKSLTSLWPEASIWFKI